MNAKEKRTGKVLLLFYHKHRRIIIYYTEPKHSFKRMRMTQLKPDVRAVLHSKKRGTLTSEAVYANAASFTDDTKQTIKPKTWQLPG
jgi:hypothetical protein